MQLAQVDYLRKVPGWRKALALQPGPNQLVIEHSALMDSAREKRRDVHTARASTLATGIGRACLAFQQAFRRRGECMLAWLGMQHDAPILQRRRACYSAHRIPLTMPAGLGGDYLAVSGEIDPDVLQLVEMSNVPVPPDRVFNRAGSAGRQGDATREGRRVAILAEYRVAEC